MRSSITYRKDINKKKIGLFDIIMLIAVIVNVAINDNLRLLIISQVLFFMVAMYVILSARSISRDNFNIIIRTVLFFVWGYLSSLWAINQTAVMEYTISNGQVLMLTIALVAYISNNTKLKRFLIAFIISALILAIRLLSTTSLSEIYQVGYHLGTAFGYDRVHIGMISSYASLFLIYFADNYKKKILYPVSLFLIFISFASGSRKGLVIILAGIVFYFLLSRRVPQKRIKIILRILIAILIAYYLINSIPFLYHAIGRRIVGFVSFLSNGSGDSSAATRSILLREAINVAFEHPILGVGLYNFKYVSSQNLCAHNNYLELICSTGLVSLLIFYYYPLKSLLRGIQRQKVNNSKLSSLVVSVLICWFICDIVVVSFAMEYVQMLVTVLMISICHLSLTDNVK